VITRTIAEAGAYAVAAEVRDEAGLTDTVTHGVAIPRFGHSRPPDARLSADPASAPAGASFRFDASASADVDGPPDHLFFRWDWENDGIFDTDWSFDRAAEHEFTKAGQHAVRVEVGDLDDMTASAIAWVRVQPTTAVQMGGRPYRAVLWPGTAWRFRALAEDAYGNAIAWPDARWSNLDPATGSMRADGAYAAGRATGCTTALTASIGDLTWSPTVCVLWPVRAYLPEARRE
jgi:hypothetical protein